MSQLRVNSISTINPLTMPMNIEATALTFNGVSNPLATQADVDSAVAAALIGFIEDRGNYDASTNLYPATGGSGTAGAILKGDLWYIGVQGTLGGVLHQVGYSIRALIDAPGQTAGNWASSNVGLGYIPENTANKANTIVAPGNSTDYATTGAVVNHVAIYAPPVGSFLDYAGRVAPAGYLACSGQSLSRVTYAALFDVRCAVIGTPTLTIASPCVATIASHGLVAGEGFFFQTTGALPTGVSADTQYFVLTSGLTINDFQFATAPGGPAINSSGTQSGVHTVRWCPDGIPDASNFYAPDTRGISRVGAGTHGSMTRADGSFYNGGAPATYRNDQFQGFKVRSDNSLLQYSPGSGSEGLSGGSLPTAQQDSSIITDGVNGTPRTGNETRPAQHSVLVCIKY